MTNKNIDELLQCYATSAKAYGASIGAGDAKQSDKHFDAVEVAFENLKQLGRPGLEAISRLLDSEDEGVRLWSAAHLLNYPEFNALPVLEQLKRSPSILSLTAEITLDQWRNGNLKY